MKLKTMVLLALFAAGALASMALAENGKKGKKADDNRCREVHISGTIAPQTLAITLDKASAKLGTAAGATLNLAVGATGQTVRVKAEACATGTTGALQLTVKKVELSPKRVKVETTTGGTTTSSRKKDDDDDHKGRGKGRDKGRTTTTTATTTATTTTATTTTAPTTTTTP
jgi:hypothetical protein